MDFATAQALLDITHQQQQIFLKLIYKAFVEFNTFPRKQLSFNGNSILGL